MAEYCTVEQLIDRLTEAGAEFVADLDHDGELSDAEKSTYLLTAIQYAGNLIDAAVTRCIPLSTARNSGNAWLRDRCLDLAAARAAGHGGRTVPEQLDADRLHAEQQLDAVENGRRVPGLVYPEPGLTSRSSRVPRAANPGRRRQ